MSLHGAIRQRALESVTIKKNIFTRIFYRATALMEEQDISPEEANKLARNQLEYEDAQIQGPEITHVF